MATTLILGIYGLTQLNLHSFTPQSDSFEVIIKIKDTIHELEVPPYSTLKEVLEQIELPDDVDYDRINPYQILKHSDVYVVPLKENKSCIHLNHADETTLMHLKGVGPSIAQRIIQYRDEVGLFSSIEEIMNVKGIGQKTFDKMKDDLCL